MISPQGNAPASCKAQAQGTPVRANQRMETGQVETIFSRRRDPVVRGGHLGSRFSGGSTRPNSSAFGRISSARRASGRRSSAGRSIITAWRWSRPAAITLPTMRGSTGDEFHTFVQPFFSHMAGLQALEWVPRVVRCRPRSFEAAVRREGFKDFQITEKGPDGRLRRAARRRRILPRVLCRALPRKRTGFRLRRGLYSRAARGARSCPPRRTIGVSAPLIPVQATDRRRVILVSLPVYESGGQPRPPPALGVRGFVLGVFRPDQIIEDALKSLEPGGIDIYVCDSPLPSSRQVAYFHASRTRRRDRTPARPRKSIDPSGIVSGDQPDDRRAAVVAADETDGGFRRHPRHVSALARAGGRRAFFPPLGRLRVGDRRADDADQDDRR